MKNKRAVISGDPSRVAMVGIDTGGTFTDFIVCFNGQLRVHKCLSTPAAPEQAILQGLADLGLADTSLHVVHGSTVATNALLERKGARVAFVTNRGFADLLTLGRQARPNLYELNPKPAQPPVPAELCLETGGRLTADGSVLEPLTNKDLESLRTQIEVLKPDAVAINLLFSFLDSSFEEQIEAALPGSLFVSRSSKVLPEIREYERGIATWLNSYVGPVMRRYLGGLAGALPAARLRIMQSQALSIAIDQAADHAVHLLLSGPAGGLAGALHMAKLSGIRNIMSFDMGGTSTDVALSDGEIQLRAEANVAGFPLAVPSVDVHTIGAGGGSVAHVDAGGLLLVGPESAGASPGPAAYGKGGSKATVTDANVVLGRLPSAVRLAGNLRLDPAAALAALTKLGSPLELSPEKAAEGVIQVVNETMAQALRVISVARGHDPNDYTLVCFGGAGGLHVCALAEALGMTRAFVPAFAGVLSALGMLVTTPGRQLSRTLNRPLQTLTDTEIESALNTLKQSGLAELRAEGAASPQQISSVDLRYMGQSSCLRLLWRGCARLEQEFHEAHRDQFGYQLDVPIELVNLRIGLICPHTAPAIPRVTNRWPASPAGWTRVHGIKPEAAIYRRNELQESQCIQGPGLIMEDTATTFIAPGWRCSPDQFGSLKLFADKIR